jgi:universal stress protein F
MEALVPKKLLLPIDLTELQLAERALAQAAALAKAFDSQIRLVNVQSLVPIAFLDYLPENFEPEIREGLAKEMTELAKKADYPQERVTTTILYGPIHHEVAAEAEAWGADLIVLCSHRPGMNRFLMGSVASAIVRNAKCSVWIVRDEAQQR